MNFIEKICREVFPNIPLKREPEPQHTVSKGLALYGRKEIQANAFEEKINVFLKKKMPGLLKDSIPELLKIIADNLAGSMLANVVKPNLVQWKNEGIKTLNDIEPAMRNSSNQWAKSQQVKQIISSVIEQWLGRIKDTLNENTNPICLEFGVPTNTIGASVLNTRADLVNMDDFEFFVGHNPEGLGWIVGYILTFIYMVLTVDILFTGFFGWVVGIVVGIIILFYGKSKSEDFVRSRNMPGWLRGTFLSEKKIDDICREKRSEISSKILGKLDKNEFKDNLLSSMTNLVNNAVKQEVKRQLLLVR